MLESAWPGMSSHERQGRDLDGTEKRPCAATSFALNLSDSLLYRFLFVVIIALLLNSHCVLALILIPCM